MKTRHLLAAVLALIVSAIDVQVVQAGPADGRLDIYWVDVEGGAATLIVTPAGETVLIDTGNPGPRDPDRITQVVTRAAGMRQIDHLVVTHYHRDHFGGAATLATMLPVKRVYDNGLFADMPERPDPTYFDFRCEERLVINPGDGIQLQQYGGSDSARVTLRCLGTRKQFIDGPTDVTTDDRQCKDHRPKERDGSDNANSVVMLLKFGPFTFFDAGDLTWNQEHKLVCPKNLVGNVDVYQVTHHGLESSNNPIVLQTLQPTVAVMNNGATKGCDPEVVANLRETKSIQAVYQMHENERSNGAANNTQADYIANRRGPCQAHFIKLSVDTTGKTYTVGIPAHGHERTYETK